MINECLFFAFLFVFLIGLCWGSFLNVVSYRLTFDKPFLTTRSQCPHCNKIISWYDNIPVFSWIWLKGRCRMCQQSITILYPCFELVTAIIAVFLAIKFYPRFFFAYSLTSNDQVLLNLEQLVNGISQASPLSTISSLLSSILFLSALIAASHADLRAFAIPQIFSLWLAPIGIVFSYLNITGISYSMSFFGACFGYGILWFVAKCFKILTKKDGLGVGDMELLCMIGAFTGPYGVWVTLTIGSITGVLIGSLYLPISGHSRMTRIPFGPFLSLGAICYFFFLQPIFSNLFIMP